MMRLFRSGGRRRICAIAPRIALVAAGLVFAAPAMAQEAADAIAQRFAADAERDAQSNKVIEEARRAVERAIEKERGEPAAAEPETAQPAIPQPNTEPEATLVDAAPASSPASSPAPSQVAPAEPVGEPQPEPSLTAAPAPPSPEDAAKREREAEALAERLRSARRQRDAVPAETPKTEPRETAADPAAKPAEEDGSLISGVVSHLAARTAGYISPLVEKRVSVLLVLDVGQTGVRRWSRTADPMLCIHENCYLSRGADEPAEKLSRSKAFGPTVALVKRGQACRSKPACIFRDIDLETVEAKLQPVDLRFLRHDRRDAKAIRADTTCAIIDGKLSCRNPVGGDSWKAWIVPESVAKRAGALGLEAAIADGIE